MRRLTSRHLGPICIGWRVLALVVAMAAAGGAPGALAAPPMEGQFAEDFTLLDPPAKVPPIALRALDGARVRLGDFAGQVVLVNFWATWCAPCVREMPSLDRLQAELAGEGLIVAAVSVDRGGAAAVEPFAAKYGLAHLRLLLDPKSEVARALGLPGLPTSYVLDRGGDVVGVLTGPAEWDSPEAKALLRHYLREPSAPKPQNAARGR